MANRKNRRNTRRVNRKNRKDRKNTRRNMRGGNAIANATGPAPVNYNLAGSSPSQMSLAQGNQYAGYHMNQHGGVAPYPGEVVGSGLPAELHASARILPLDGYFNDIRGLKDPNQMGAGRRRRNARKASRKGRKANRKDRKASRKMYRKSTRKSERKGSRRNRRNTRRNQAGGGAVYNSEPASVSAPGLLLDPATEAKAIRGMNPEWYLAPDPNAFTPKA
jgi:hypothetical protein